jgi:hypothetical protein
MVIITPHKQVADKNLPPQGKNGVEKRVLDSGKQN